MAKDVTVRTTGWSGGWMFGLVLVVLLFYCANSDMDVFDRDIGIILQIKEGGLGSDVRTRIGNYLVINPHTLSVGEEAEIYIDKIGFQWVVGRSGGRGRLYGGRKW